MPTFFSRYTVYHSLGKRALTFWHKNYVEGFYESPRELVDQLAFEGFIAAAHAAATDALGRDGLRLVANWRPTKEPFLGLVAAGWQKAEMVVETVHGPLALHGMVSPSGETRHLKVVVRGRAAKNRYPQVAFDG